MRSIRSGPLSVATGVFTGNVFTNGHTTITGDLTVYDPNKAAAVLHPDGSYRRLYCVEAPESYFEDVGRGQMTNGRGQVRLDPDFAAVIRTDT